MEPVLRGWFFSIWRLIVVFIKTIHNILLLQLNGVNICEISTIIFVLIYGIIFIHMEININILKGG